MLKYLLALLFVSMHLPAFAQNTRFESDLQRLDQSATVITKQMGNGDVTLDLILTLWNRPRLDNGVQDVYRDIKEELSNRLRITEDSRDADRWRRDTRIGSNQHCFILLNDFEAETGRRLIYFGCGLEKASLLGIDEYWRLKETFFRQFGRIYRQTNLR